MTSLIRNSPNENIYIEWTLNHIDANDKEVRYIGRKPAASPASGYLKKHLEQQKKILHKLLS